MSDIFRRSVLSRAPPLPPTRAPWADDPDEGDEQFDGEDFDELSELGAMLPPSTLSSSSSRPTVDLTPLSASSFFEQALEVNPTGNPTTFRVYITPPSFNSQPSESSSSGSSGPNSNGTYLICHHGAGAGGLSFAALAKEVKEKSGGELGVLSFDCRGHGKTRTIGPKSADTDISLQTLDSDFMEIILHLFPDSKTAPALVLLGHSMGAAPILSTAPELQKMGYKIPGVIVLDVVEGTAVEALPIMKTILAQRPPLFKSVVDGIQWHLQSNSIRNPESARVSVPSYLVPAPTYPASSSSGSDEHQVWRTDLLATEPYWLEWYKGLSGRFLAAKCARLLVLAGQERLDKELMVGQMQGKFQLEVMSDVGHYLHEDNPSSLASTIVAFWRRNTRVIVLPSKIGAGGASERSGPSGSAVTVRRVGEE